MNASARYEFYDTMVSSLGHSLWQGALIALGVWLLGRLSNSALTRYRVLVLGLFAMAACPPMTFVVMRNSGFELMDWRAISSEQRYAVEVRGETRGSTKAVDGVTKRSHSADSQTGSENKWNAVEPEPAATFKRTVESSSDDMEKPTGNRMRWSPVVARAYLACVVLMLFRMVLGLWGGWQLHRLARPILDSNVVAVLRRQAKAMQLRVVPAFASCDQVLVPTVIGVVKPTILLPMAILNGLSIDQIETVLAHEMAHLKRYDHLVNLLQRLVEAMLFYHPAVWWLSREIRIEREHCCDDLVLACGSSRLDYAEMLLRVAELSRDHREPVFQAPPGLFATGAQPSMLRHRITRILGGSDVTTVRGRHPAPLAMILMIAMGVAYGAWNTLAVEVVDEPRRQVTENAMGKVAVELPNSRTLELIGVALARVGKEQNVVRKANGWWRPDGTTLRHVPFELARLPVADPAGMHFREFLLRTRTVVRNNAPAPRLIPLVVHGGKWSGMRDGLPLRVESWKPEGYMVHQFLVGFDDETKPGAFSFYYSDAVNEEGGHMSLDGRVHVRDGASSRTSRLLQSLKLASVVSSSARTVVSLSPNNLLKGPLQLHVNGILADGRTIAAQIPSNYERLVFETGGVELEALQLNVRPMTHRVDCENIALQAGQECSPRVTITPLDECFSIEVRKMSELGASRVD